MRGLLAGRPMSQPTVDLKKLLVGRLVGEGQIVGWSGRSLRTFSSEFFGEWSIGHDALHLDETLVYADGREFRRNWVIQFDAEGALLGHDSGQTARLRGRQTAEEIHIVFDPPLGLPAEIQGSRAALKLLEVSDGVFSVEGRVGLFGLALRRVQATLYRA